MEDISDEEREDEGVRGLEEVNHGTREEGEEEDDGEERVEEELREAAGRRRVKKRKKRSVCSCRRR